VTSPEPDRAEGPLPGERPALPVLVGCTAAGKTELSLELAERLGAEILSMDSMLVYRGLDVGTAKPTAVQRARVPHHLIDLVEPDERYDVQRYLQDFEAAERDVRSRGALPLVVGGTGFYLQAILFGLFAGPPVDPELRARIETRAREEGLALLHAELGERDPASAARIHPNDRKRVVRALEVLEQTGRPLSEWQAEWGWKGEERPGRPRRIVGLAREEPGLTDRIRARTHEMLEAGWVEEALRVRAGAGFGPTAIQALGYREVLAHADGELTCSELVERIVLRTRQFARRQRTWFRRFAEILWIGPDDASAVEAVEAELFGPR